MDFSNSLLKRTSKSRMEKVGVTDSALPGARARPRAKGCSRLHKSFLGLFGFVTGAYLLAAYRGVIDLSWVSCGHGHGHGHRHGQDSIFEGRCVQPEPLFPRRDEALDEAFDAIGTDTFRNASVQRLSGAVRVQTESFDDLGAVGEDARWDVFYDFHAYLKATFPLVHARLRVEKINTHGLLYTWQGSEAALRPTLLMAHQDTVPVPPETRGAWTHPPFGGVYDGRYVWGRGASDCKNQLIAALEAVEVLLGAGDGAFAPRRTVLLAFGFDEECAGAQGAMRISAFLRDRYGDDGLAVIVDEGAAYGRTWGTLFFTPGTGEKGYVNVDVTVRMPGGHSSVPPDHTSIGVLGELISRLEADRYPTRLADENPYYAQLQCGAAHSPDFPPTLRKLLARRLSSSSSSSGGKPDRLALEAARLGGPYIRYLMTTSQAVDIVAGGAKVNALPERAMATVNHRVNIGETSHVVLERMTAVAAGVAAKHNLTLHAFESDGHETPSSITLTAGRDTLKPAPVTPADAAVDGPYRVLAGTTRALFGADAVVSPSIMTGNTDTRYYWALTRHIFRFSPAYDPDAGNPLVDDRIHTVDEHTSVRGHLNAVKWFTLFLRNMDEADF